MKHGPANPPADPGRLDHTVTGDPARKAGTGARKHSQPAAVTSDCRNEKPPRTQSGPGALHQRDRRSLAVPALTRRGTLAPHPAGNTELRDSRHASSAPTVDIDR